MNASTTPDLVIPTEPVESSQIAEIGHDAATNTLAIRFPSKKGPDSLYYYADFTAEQFEAFKTAESIGSYFGKFIKKETEKHPYRRVVEQAAVEAQLEQNVELSTEG